MCFDLKMYYELRPDKIAYSLKHNWRQLLEVYVCKHEYYSSDYYYPVTDEVITSYFNWNKGQYQNMVKRAKKYKKQKLIILWFQIVYVLLMIYLIPMTYTCALPEMLSEMPTCDIGWLYFLTFLLSLLPLNIYFDIMESRSA